MRQVGLGNTHAVIGHTDNEFPVFFPRSDSNLAEILTIGDGVLDQVAHYCAQVIRQGVNIDTLLPRRISELDVAAHTLLTVTLDNHADERHGIKVDHFGVADCTAHTTHLEDTVNELKQVVALTLNDFHVFQYTGRRRCGRMFSIIDQVVDGTHNGGQRSAQAVHDVGKEERTRLLNLAHHALGTGAHPHGIDQSGDDGARHECEQHAQHAHHVAGVFQPCDVIIERIHFSNLALSLILEVMVAYLIVRLWTIDAVGQLIALHMVPQRLIGISLEQCQLTMRFVGQCQMLKAVDALGLALSLSHIVTGLVLVAQLDAHIGQRQARLQPVPLVILPQTVIGDAVFLLGMRESAIGLIELPKVQMAQCDSHFVVIQLIAFQRLAIIDPCRVNFILLVLD